MLENKCPTCGRNLGTGYKCPVCSVYIPPKQDMKTPTKEQIDYIRKQMDLLSTPLEDIPVIAIEIWENIRGE